MHKKEPEEPSLEGYFRYMSNELKKHNIPEEVYYVYFLQRCNATVGKTTYDQCQAIIDKYPEHFPWEHKYKKIPQHIHETHSKESVENIFKFFKAPMFDDKGEKRDGLFKSMVDYGAMKSEPVTEKSIKEAFQSFYDMQHKQEKDLVDAKKKAKVIWDKYYKKYNLPYRP